MKSLVILKVIHDSFRIDNVVAETPSVDRECRTTGINLNIPRTVLRRTAAGSPSGRATQSPARFQGSWPRDIAIVTEGSIAGDTVQIRQKLRPVFDAASRYKVFYKPEGRKLTRLADRYPACGSVSVIISFDLSPSTKGYEWSSVRDRMVHRLLEEDYFLERESDGDEAFEGHGLKATDIEGTTQEMDLRSGKRRCTEFQFYHPEDLHTRYRLSVYYVWNKIQGVYTLCPRPMQCWIFCMSTVDSR